MNMSRKEKSNYKENEKRKKKRSITIFYFRIKKMKEKPSINEKSKLIAAELSQRPIYERFDKIVEDKKKKMEEYE